MNKLQKYLDEVKERADGATPLWDARVNEFSNTAQPRYIWSDPYGWIARFEGTSGGVDAEFAAHSRQDIPALLDMVEELLKNKSCACEELAMRGSYSGCASCNNLKEVDKLIPGGSE